MVLSYDERVSWGNGALGPGPRFASDFVTFVIH